MTMGYVCAICRESIEKNPGEKPDERRINDETANLSAAPCGHIFHSYCINRWINSGIPSSERCPNCRNRIPRKSLLSLFPDCYDDIDSPTSPELTKCDSHAHVIISLQSKLHKVEADFKIQLTLYELLMKDLHKNKLSFQSQERRKAEEFAMYREEANRQKYNLELENHKLKLEIAKANHKIDSEVNEKELMKRDLSDFLSRKAQEAYDSYQSYKNMTHNLSSSQTNSFLSMGKTEEPKPGPSRFCKPSFSGGKKMFNRPKRGKKMVYEKNEADDMDEVVCDEESEGEKYEYSWTPGSRKRKLNGTSFRFMGEFPKMKIKKPSPTEIMSPITLSSGPDTDDEPCIVVNPASVPDTSNSSSSSSSSGTIVTSSLLVSSPSSENVLEETTTPSPLDAQLSNMDLDSSPDDQAVNLSLSA